MNRNHSGYRLSVAAASMFVALALTACGGGGGDDASSLTTVISGQPLERAERAKSSDKQTGRPESFDISFTMLSGEACAFPIEVHADGKLKELRFAENRLITLWPNLGITVINAADRSKRIELRGGGTFHEVLRADGAYVGTYTGHVYFFGVDYGASMLIGNFDAIISPDGSVTPPVGHVRQFDLCSRIQ